MDDLIRRSDAIKAIMNKPAWHGSEGSWFHSDDIKDAIESVPAVEPKQGEWIFQECTDEIYGRAYECSICGVAVVGNHHHFCPNCGAKMKGADDEDSNMGHSDM